MKNCIHLRIFSEVDNIDRALKVSDKVVNILKIIGCADINIMRKYWKIPEYYETSLTVKRKVLEHQDCERVADLLGGTWVNNDSGTELTSSEDSVFKIKEIRWAHIELLGD